MTHDLNFTCVSRCVLPLLLAASLLFAAGCAEGQAVQETQPVAPGDPRAFDSREVHNFREIAAVVRTADAVVLGTVESLEADRPDGPPGEETYYSVATVRVDEVWAGRNSPSAGDIIVVETLRAQPYALDWHQPGTKVLLALTETDGEGPVRYNPTSSQVAWVVQDEDLLATQDDPFAVQVAEMTLSEVRARVKKGS